MATIQQRFEAYHAEHPEVFALFRAYAKMVRSRGWKRFGAKAVMERIRWEFAVQRGEGEAFKIQNDFTSRYVRMLIHDDPSFEGFFALRELREGSAPEYEDEFERETLDDVRERTRAEDERRSGKRAAGDAQTELF